MKQLFSTCCDDCVFCTYTTGGGHQAYYCGLIEHEEEDEDSFINATIVEWDVARDVQINDDDFKIYQEPAGEFKGRLKNCPLPVSVLGVRGG